MPYPDTVYSEFDQGMRTAFLQVRSFILKHPLKEVDAFCAAALHDMRSDAEQRDRKRRAADQAQRDKIAGQ